MVHLNGSEIIAYQTVATLIKKRRRGGFPLVWLSQERYHLTLYCNGARMQEQKPSLKQQNGKHAAQENLPAS